MYLRFFRRFTVGLITALVFSVLTLGVTPVTAWGQSGYVSDNTLTYSGGYLNRYATLADAQANTNLLSTSVFAQRDGSAYFGLNNAAFTEDPGAPNAAIWLTNWFQGNQNTNPNNTSQSFMQLYDSDAGSLSSMQMAWNNAARNSWSMTASGGNTITGCSTIPPQDCGRMWDGTTSANGGSFLSWNYSLAVSGLSDAVWNAVTGVWESASRPTSATGQFSGMFADATTGEYYNFSVDIGNTGSYAWQQSGVDMPIYGASTTVPEPSTYALMAVGLAALAYASRRRKIKSDVSQLPMLA